MKNGEILAGLFLFTFIALIVSVLAIFVPLGLIWALNTLFQLGIAYTLKTWAAALILIILFSRMKTDYKEGKKQ